MYLFHYSCVVRPLLVDALAYRKPVWVHLINTELICFFSSQVIKAVINARGRYQLKAISSSMRCRCVLILSVCVCDQRQIQFFHFTSVLVSTAFHSSMNTINPCILILWLPWLHVFPLFSSEKDVGFIRFRCPAWDQRHYINTGVLMEMANSLQIFLFILLYFTVI